MDCRLLLLLLLLGRMHKNPREYRPKPQKHRIPCSQVVLALVLASRQLLRAARADGDGQHAFTSQQQLPRGLGPVTQAQIRLMLDDATGDERCVVQFSSAWAHPAAIVLWSTRKGCQVYGGVHSGMPQARQWEGSQSSGVATIGS